MVPRGLTRAGLSCSVLLRAEEPAGTKEEEEGAKDTYARVHTHTHTLRSAGAHTHSWHPHMICCIYTFLSLASTPQGWSFPIWGPSILGGADFLPKSWASLLQAGGCPPEPCWAGSACPRPEHRTSGGQGAGGGGSLLDDGGQLRAEVLAVEPLLIQDVCGVPYVVPARTKDGHPALHLGVAGQPPSGLALLVDDSARLAPQS